MKIIAMLLLGITLQYNTAYTSINDEAVVDEKLEIIITEDDLKSNNLSQNDFIRKIETDYLSSLNLDGYDTQKTEQDGNIVLSLSKRYSNPYEYAENTVFKNQLFGNVIVADYSAQEYTVNYDSSFFEENLNALSSGSYRFNMTIPYSVSSNNATENNGNVYTWNINTPRTISTTFDITKQSVATASPDSSIWDTFPIKFDFTTIMLIIIIGGLGVLTLFAFLKHTANNTI